MEYPYEIFVSLLHLPKDEACYMLADMERGWVENMHNWECSHFRTVGPSRLAWHGGRKLAHAMVTLQCTQYPVPILGRAHRRPFVWFSKDGKVEMRHRIEVSGKEIKDGNPKPIRFYDGPDHDDPFQWVTDILFFDVVFGQREGYNVWLETTGGVMVK